MNFLTYKNIYAYYFNFYNSKHVLNCNLNSVLFDSLKFVLFKIFVRIKNIIYIILPKMSFFSFPELWFFFSVSYSFVRFFFLCAKKRVVFFKQLILIFKLLRKKKKKTGLVRKITLFRIRKYKKLNFKKKRYKKHKNVFYYKFYPFKTFSLVMNRKIKPFFLNLLYNKILLQNLPISFKFRFQKQQINFFERKKNIELSLYSITDQYSCWSSKYITNTWKSATGLNLKNFFFWIFYYCTTNYDMYQILRKQKIIHNIRKKKNDFKQKKFFKVQKITQYSMLLKILSLFLNKNINKIPFSLNIKNEFLNFFQNPAYSRFLLLFRIFKNTMSSNTHFKWKNRN